MSEGVCTKKKVKTISGWESSGALYWDSYCKPGDLVDEEVFHYFMNVMSPVNMSYGYLQIGEPYSHCENPETGRWQPTYSTFCLRDGCYRYCGHCFVGKTEPVE